MTTAPCYFCGEPFDPKTAYKLVEGWERPHRGLNDRSGSSLVLRRTRQVGAHPECIAAVKAGVSVHQETLV